MLAARRMCGMPPPSTASLGGVAASGQAPVPRAALPATSAARPAEGALELVTRKRPRETTAVSDPPLAASVHGVAALMLEAARTVKATRDSRASIMGAGLPAAFASLSGEEMALSTQLARREHDFNAVKPRMYRHQYMDFVAAYFPGRPQLPVVFTCLRAFVSQYVVGRGNKASNLSDVLSGLFRGTNCSGAWAVSEQERDVINADARWLKLMYPSPPTVTRALSTGERVLLYSACASGGAEGALAMAIVKMGVAGQMRFEEVICLWEEDVQFGQHGILVNVVRDKTHQTTLTPYPRICPRYPPWFKEHDAWIEVKNFKARYGAGAPRGAGPPRAARPFFTKLVKTEDGFRASEEKLDAPYVRELLLRFLRVAIVGDAAACLNLHCFRSSGFNDIANQLYLGRVVAAEAGGWTEGGCVAESYQRRTALDLSCSIYIELLRVCDLLGRPRPSSTA